MVVEESQPDPVGPSREGGLFVGELCQMCATRRNLKFVPTFFRSDSQEAVLTSNNTSRIQVLDMYCG